MYVYGHGWVTDMYGDSVLCPFLLYLSMLPSLRLNKHDFCKHLNLNSKHFPYVVCLNAVFLTECNPYKPLEKKKNHHFFVNLKSHEQRWCILFTLFSVYFCLCQHLKCFLLEVQIPLWY